MKNRRSELLLVGTSNNHNVHTNTGNRQTTMVLSADSDYSETSCVSVQHSGKYTFPSLDDDSIHVFPKKQVRINEDCNEIFYQAVSSSVDRAKSWYCSSDYQAFRSRFADDLSTLRASESSTILGGLYSTCCEVSYKLLDVSEILSVAFNEQIAELTARKEGRFGFEQRVVRISNSTATARGDVIQDIVQDIQEEFDEGEWDLEEYAEELRECCITFSQADSLFAQVVGKIHRLEIVWGQ